MTATVEIVHGVIETGDEARLLVLAATVREAIGSAAVAQTSMIDHAVRCGEALLEAKTLVPPGQWGRWIDDNIPHNVRRAMCGNYMRLAALKKYVDPELSITANVQLVRGLERRVAATPRVPAAVKEEALRLHATGEFTNQAIAQMVGVTKDTIHAWTDPEWQARKVQKANHNRREARKLLRLSEDGDVVPEEASQDERAFRYGEPGRAAVGRAVRGLATVQGRAATREAALVLAAICTAWAARLAESSQSTA